MKMFDTIAAVATPIGVGGIAVIRISGEGAAGAAEKIACLKNGKSLSDGESHRLYLADIVRADGEIIDEALVTVMRAPHSYTGEDVAEINCHGGYFAAGMIMEELFKNGVRQAEAGEFTRRAFVNGKTDLLRAEAVIDVIHANSELGQSNAAKALSGKLSEKVNKIREKAMAFAAELSAIADYPEEMDELSAAEINLRIDGIAEDVREMTEGFKRGRILRDGIVTVIAGRPNVGKSSVLNALSGTERAIVTDIPGTTRDTVEEYVSIGGIALRLIDTAGIRESDDSVERIGIERAKENIGLADLCLFVIDSSEEVSDEDRRIAERLRGVNTIVLINKTDKGAPRDAEYYEKELGIGAENFVLTATPKDSAAMGITELEKKIADRFLSGGIAKDDVFISNDRQKNALIHAQNILEGMKESVAAGMPADLLYIDLEDAVGALGEVTGQTVQDEIIDQVFERFCVGK